ncbi:sca1 complex scaffold protein scaa [Anaeramoeba flamelloides]|uniref:Sca1 complex scaffold protein scaa n=1 Tax=Anaeramoeba flamelloides TaxID=1746091 RepID=A0AAV8ACD3_9EUKA|nr:sca1 complex scaffold protein scaa [Anaeramoeba flamelloides]
MTNPIARAARITRNMSYKIIPKISGFREGYDAPFINVQEYIKPTELEKKQSNNTCVYLDSEGNCYDLNYLPIKKKIKFRNKDFPQFDEYQIANRKDLLQTEQFSQFSQLYNPEPFDSLPKFPEMEDFENYSDFEQAAIEWHSITQKKIGLLQLPQQIGANLYRPPSNLNKKKNQDQSYNILNVEQPSEKETTPKQEETGFLNEKDNQKNEQVQPKESDNLLNDEEFYTLSQQEELEILRYLQTGIVPQLEKNAKTFNNEKINKNEIKKEGNEKEKEKEKENEIENKNKNEEVKKEQENENGIKKEKNENENENQEEQEQEKEQENKEQDRDDNENTKVNQEKIIANEKNYQEKSEKKMNFYLHSKQPWDTKLIPTEPKPEYYLTFEDYHRACKRWSQIVISKLEPIPMHPRQLKEQALLKSYKKTIKKKKKIKRTADLNLDHFHWINKIEHIFKREFKPNYNLSQQKIAPSYFAPKLKSMWKKLPNETKEQISNVFEKIQKKTLLNRKKFNTNYGILLGRYTPTLNKELIMKKIINKKKNQNKIDISKQNNDKRSTNEKNEINVTDEINNAMVTNVTNVTNETKETKETNEIKNTDNTNNTNGINSTNQKKNNNKKNTENSKEKNKSQKKKRKKKKKKKNVSKNQCYSILTRNIKKKYQKKRYPNLKKNQKIIFIVPPFEFTKKISWSGFLETKNYKVVAKQYQSFENSSHFQQKYYHYSPYFYQKSLQKENKIILNNFQKQKQCGIDDLIKILTLRQSICKFKIWTMKTPILQKIFSIINQENFNLIISLFNNTNNKNTHIKIVSLISDYLSTQKGIEQILFSIKTKNLEQLYFINYSIYRDNLSTFQIFPYFKEILYYIQILFNENTTFFLLQEDICLLYYLNLIKNFYSVEKVKKINQNDKLLTSLREKKKDLINKIIISLSKNDCQEIELLFQGLLSKSSTVTTYFLFLFTRIIKIINPVLSNLLLSEKIAFTKFLYKFSTSKFSYTKKASMIMWNFLQQPQLKKYYINYFSENSKFFLKCFFQSKPSHNQKELNEFDKEFKIEKNILQNPKLYEDYQDPERIIQEIKQFGLIGENNNIELTSTLIRSITQFYIPLFNQILNNHSLIDFQTTNLFAGRFGREFIRKIELNLTKNLSNMIFVTRFLSKYLKCLYFLNLIIGPCFAYEGRGVELLTDNDRERWFKSLKSHSSENLKSKAKTKPKLKPKLSSSDLSSKRASLKSNPTPKSESKDKRVARKSYLKQSPTFPSPDFSPNFTKSKYKSTHLIHSNQQNRSFKKIIYSMKKVSASNSKLSNDPFLDLQLGVHFVKSDVFRFFKLLYRIINQKNPCGKYILDSLKYLLRERTVYLSVYQDSLLFEYLKIFCFNTVDHNSNKKSWKLFYQLIAHHSETLTLLINEDILKKFLMTPNDPIAIAYQAKYFNKLLKIVQINEQRMKKRNKKHYRWYKNDPLKSLLEDRKKFIQYLIKTIWYTRLHLNFKKFDKEFSGYPFIEISNIYNTIMNNNYCSKLLKKLKNHEDYSYGIKFFLRFENLKKSKN